MTRKAPQIDSVYPTTSLSPFRAVAAPVSVSGHTLGFCTLPYPTDDADYRVVTHPPQRGNTSAGLVL